MSLEAARDLSILDLLQVLNEKLRLEGGRLQQTTLPPVSSPGLLGPEIDSLEARAQEVLRCISFLRNLLQPVNRLPPEILSDIARHLVGEFVEDVMPIVPLTHVCRYWRKSITSDPRNWALISGRNEDMTAVSLDRAKAVPLEIAFFMPWIMEYSSFPDILMSHFQKMRTLNIDRISDVEDFVYMFPGFPQSMPNLRSLTLVHSEISECNRSIDLFESFIPPLERLSLEGFPLYSPLLRLRTLTEFSIQDPSFNLSLNALLDFLEANSSLERVSLDIGFPESPLRRPQSNTGIKNNLRDLFISCPDVIGAQALISSIPLRRGAELHVNLSDMDITLSDFLPKISTVHISGPPSPTSFYLGQSFIVLAGPGGKVSFCGCSFAKVSPADFEELPLADVRKLHLYYRKVTAIAGPGSPVFYPSYFPALETLIIDCDVDLLDVFSILLSNSSSSRSLKTLGFLNCDLSEVVMDRLANFARERQNTSTSALLHRVEIVSENGAFPSVASIRMLKNHVEIVEVRRGNKFSADLA